jgi:hypothetical protein
MRVPAWGLLLCATALVADARSARAQEHSDSAPREEAPPNATRPPHPEPRVIVSVLSVRGPHRQTEVERSARLAWGRIVKCYKSIDQQARGKVAVELVVSSSGKVTRSKRLGSTLKNGELTACLTNTMKGLSMPKARAGSTAKAEIHVAPGDPP